MAMTPTRRLNRRSFLAQVAGGAAAAGALGVIGGTARAQTGPYTGVTDNDSGSHADNAGHGRGPGGNASGQPAQPQGGQTGYSDSDSGANADPSGGGRRGQRPQTGITDGDPTDPYGQGHGTSGGTTHNSVSAAPTAASPAIPASPTATAARAATRPITGAAGANAATPTRASRTGATAIRCGAASEGGGPVTALG